MDKLRAPFPYFGGKGAIAKEVWNRFGAVRNFRRTILRLWRCSACPPAAVCWHGNGE